MPQIVPIETLNNLKGFTLWEATLTGVKTDFAISPAISTTQRLIVAPPLITLGADSAASAAVRIGFAAATLPAEAEGGVAGIIAPHGKLAAGSGFHGIAGMGAAGEELRITNETPSPGKLKIVYRYKIVNA